MSMEDLLKYIKKNPGISQTNLRKAFNVQGGSVQKQLEKLRFRGYITRKAYKRSWLLYPTDEE